MILGGLLHEVLVVAALQFNGNRSGDSTGGQRGLGPQNFSWPFCLPPTFIGRYKQGHI